MKEFITVYLFYLVGRDLDYKKYPAIVMRDVRWCNGIGTVFYAFTPRKDMAKQFMEMRDNKKFEKRELLMDANEYEKFNNKYSEYQLNDYSYKMVVYSDNGDKFKSDCAYILSTEAEYNEVHYNTVEHLLNYLDIDEIQMDGVLFLLYQDAFRHKYRKALNYLLHDSDALYGVLYPYEATETVEADEASLYMHLFHNTFKEGRKIKCESLSFIKNLKTI